MINTFLWFLQTLLLLRCVNADDVGPAFDPKDEDAWENLHGYFPWRTYQSTDVTSPAVARKIDSPECYDDRQIFFTPRGDIVYNQGPYIMDNHGELVWAHSVEAQPYNFKMQMYKGEQHLTYWLGDDGVGGHGEGDYYILNSAYQMVAKVSALNGFRADLHEMVITPEGTAIISIYQIYPVRDKKNKRVYIWDCLFQEINIETGELTFQWRASDHHSIEDSFRDREGDGSSRAHPWDWYHVNSIQKDVHGNYLISARYVHAITYVHGTTGEVIWVLGGKRNMFEDTSWGSAINFASQHHAQFHPLTDFPNLLKDAIKAHGPNPDNNGTTKQLISLFDNGRDDTGTSHKISRGLLVEITYPTVVADAGSANTEPGHLKKRGNEYTVREVKSYDHPDGVSSESQGSLQVIPSVLDGHDSDVLIGYGHMALWTEFSAEGDVLCDTHFATEKALEHFDAQSYRVLKFPWVGRPVEPPVAILSVQSSVFVSWNGATEVDSWVLQHTNSSIDFNAANKLQVDWEDYDTVGKQKFETEIELYCDTKRYLRVLALDKNDNVIGTSNTMDLGPHGTITRLRTEIDADVHNSTSSPMQVAFYIDTTTTVWIKVLILILFSVSFACFLYAGYSKFISPQWQIQEHKYDRINSVSSAGVSLV